jgi:hypothetical protein
MIIRAMLAQEQTPDQRCIHRQPSGAEHEPRRLLGEKHYQRSIQTTHLTIAEVSTGLSKQEEEWCCNYPEADHGRHYSYSALQTQNILP